MRALVITDIHGNSVALETVLNHVKDEIDAVWCLGDVVGYGPNPNECISLLNEQNNLVCLLGNHDAAAAKDMDVSSFNAEARLSVDWTKSELTQESLSFLQALPETEIIGDVTLAHGSPRQPVFEYLLDTITATENFEFFDTDFCFVGHTHLPVHFHLISETNYASLSIPELEKINTIPSRSILNPGSIGQPRDRDPRASFAIFDSKEKSWDYRRIEYDIEKTQKRMSSLKMPERQIIRLSSGW